MISSMKIKELIGYDNAVNLMQHLSNTEYKPHKQITKVERYSQTKHNKTMHRPINYYDLDECEKYIKKESIQYSRLMKLKELSNDYKNKI